MSSGLLVWAGAGAAQITASMNPSEREAAFLMVCSGSSYVSAVQPECFNTQGVYRKVHFFWFDWADNTTSFELMSTIV